MQVRNDKPSFRAVSTLYDYLAKERGKDDHGENKDMESIIEPFIMYDLEPVNGRLQPKA